jgi:hypothetical protein
MVILGRGFIKQQHRSYIELYLDFGLLAIAGGRLEIKVSKKVKLSL